MSEAAPANRSTIAIADSRGKLELERYVDDDGDPSILISQTPYPQTFRLALSPDEARSIAALLMDYAKAQPSTPHGETNE